MSKKNKRICKGILYFIIIIAFLCAINVGISYKWLTVSEFTVESSQISTPLRIVLVSDLHDHELGKENHRLIKKITEQSPDMIVLNGDMINEDSADSHIATDLIQVLKDIAPVYYSLGNHEYDYIEVGHPELVEELEDAGAVILNYNVVDVEINGNAVRLGGLYEYGFETGMQSDEENQKAIPYLEQLTDTDRYLIMCAHRPESFYCWDWADKWGLDLQLSGHLHGGQVIIPFVGGLYCPLNGFFPKYDYGQYKVGNCDMVITRGLGTNRKALPRFNNPPEIAVIDLEPKG